MEAEYKHYFNTFFVKIENLKSVVVILDEKIEYYNYYMPDSFSDYTKTTEKHFLNALNRTIFTINKKIINGL